MNKRTKVGVAHLPNINAINNRAKASSCFLQSVCHFFSFHSFDIMFHYTSTISRIRLLLRFFMILIGHADTFNLSLNICRMLENIIFDF